jgi:hypothetical protein
MIPFLLINFVDAGKGKKKNITEKTTAYELNSGKPAPVDEMRKKLMMVHITNVIPLDGIMVPGAIHFKPNESSIEENLKYSKNLPRTRVTLHWCAGGAVEDHETKGNPTVWSKLKYAIIEPFKNVEEELLGGYMEDFFTDGTHKLSDDAIILVPQNEGNKIVKQYPTLKKHFIAYNPEKTNVAKAANFYIKNKGFWSINVPQNQIEETTLEIKNIDELTKYSAYLNKENLSKFLLDLMQNKTVKVPVKSLVKPKKMEIKVDGYKFEAGTFFKNLIEERKLEFSLYSQSLLGEFEDLLRNSLFSPLFFKYYGNPSHYQMDIDKEKNKYFLLNYQLNDFIKKYKIHIENIQKIYDKSCNKTYVENFLKEVDLWVKVIMESEYKSLESKKSLFNLAKEEESNILIKKYGSPLDFKKLSSEELDKLIIKGDEETLNELIKDCHKQIEEQGLRKVTFDEEKKEEVFN